MNSVGRLLAGKEALHGRSKGRRGPGKVQAGPARCGKVRRGLTERWAVWCAAWFDCTDDRCWGRRRLQRGGKRTREGMGSKRRVRRSWWRSLLPVGAREDVRRPQMGPVVVLRGGGGFGGSSGAQEGSERVHGGVEEVWEATMVLLLPSTRRWPEWVQRTIILSPLSLYGSHWNGLVQVGSWAVHGGGE